MTESPVDVAAIRAALGKATPGEWEGADLLFSWQQDEEGDAGQLVTVGEAERHEDAELIVLLRNNAEALLDALERAGRDRDVAAENVRRLRYSVEIRDEHEADLTRQRDEALDALDRAQAASEGVDMLIAQAERRGAVKALRDIAGWMYPVSASLHVKHRADEIENGADLA